MADPCPSTKSNQPPSCGYYSGLQAGETIDMVENGEVCPAPKTSCFADNKTQVTSGVRGNKNFAARKDFQQCYDAALYKMCDPRQGNDCTYVLADGVATCQMNVDKRMGMAHVCPTFTNAGFLNPATASMHSAEGINASASFDWMTHTCNKGFKGPTPSPAQGCLEDIDPTKLASAGLVQASTTYTSKVGRSVATSSGATIQETYTYTAPEVGQNAVMRMSRMPVFLDMTKPTAARVLAKNFYAMHKRWGGSDNAPCCGGPEEPAVGTCTTAGKTGGATCSQPQGSECPAPATQSKCNHPHNWWNGGVRKENIYIAKRAAAPDSTQSDPSSWQQTLCLRIQGEKAKIGTPSTLSDPASGLPALGRSVDLGSSDVHNYTTFSSDKGYSRELVGCETCKVYPEDANNAQRVGAILTSAQNYGSGLFEVFARIPPGNKAEHGGLGFVAALWTFNYHETYPLYAMPSSFPNVQTIDGGWAVDPAGQQLVGNIVDNNPVLAKHMEYNGQNRFSCGLFSHNCDLTQNWCPPALYGKPGQRACGIGGSVLNDGPFTTWNHEIDIEIPTNACRMPKVNTCDSSSKAPSKRPTVPPEGICGWNTDTINLNSWIGDDEDYMDGSPYRNNGVRRMDGGSFIARKQNDFHWYGIVWCTGDDAKDQKPYIDFYIDRKLVHRITDTFVPSRAGKLNFGPWFGWWGGNANFANKEIWIKYLNIVPFAAVNDPFLKEPRSDVNVSALATHWTKDDGITPKGSQPFTLPKLTPAQLNELYTTVTATQTDAPAPPCDWRVHTCDVMNAMNDINSPQVFDQCGNSALKNICDFAEFLTAEDGLPQGFPGQVIAAIEPRKCVRTDPVSKVTAGETLAQQFTIHNNTVTTELETTLDRTQFFDVSVDPDPNMTDNVRPVFQQNQFTEGADGEGAVLCGMKEATRYCNARTPGLSTDTTLLANTVAAQANRIRLRPKAPLCPKPLMIGLSIGFLCLVLLAVLWLVAVTNSSKRRR